MSKISLETLLYDPDLVEPGRRAFDLVWRMYDAVYPRESVAREAARDTLWDAIILAMQSGDRDIGRLRQLGLAGLMRYRNCGPNSMSSCRGPTLRRQKIDPSAA